jgi:DNA topoisomerase-1
MKKTLLVVESPNKIKTIQKYLGPEFIIRASYGHMMDLSTGPNDLGVNIDNNFTPKYQILPDKKNKVDAIIDAASNVDEILLASDDDREGESIAYHLANLLKSTGKPIKRAVIREITKTGIKAGVSSPREIDLNLVSSQQARRVLDRLVGFMVSPYIMETYGPKLSAGRVQSVALRLIVDKEIEIEKFIPEEYWYITSSLYNDNKKDNFTVKYNEKIKITNEKTANEIKQDLEKAKYFVEHIEQKEKKQNPYPPFITSSLAATAAGKYKFSAARTMKAAQSLYESGLITYMRTDSFRISEEAIISCREFLQNKKIELPKEFNLYSKTNGQDAHEAIRPTDIYSLPAGMLLLEDEKKIYQLIWERFVASQMKPAIFDTLSVIVKTDNGHILKTNGRVLKDKGWLEITEDFEDSSKDVKLPPLKIGDQLFLIEPKVKSIQKFTQPPSRFSEKTLIKELEKKEIGRPSTYASIMSKIRDRSYVEEKSQMFFPTELGRNVSLNISKYFEFTNYDYTALMEKQLDLIAEGKLDYLSMLNVFYSPFKSQLKAAYNSIKQDYGIKCEICQDLMQLKNGRFGYYMACANYPKNCKNTFSCELKDGKPIKLNNNNIINNNIKCPKCQLGMIERNGKYGSFYSCSSGCGGTRKVPIGKQCSDCGGQLFKTIFKGQNVLFCMNYPKCSHREDLNEPVTSLKEVILKPNKIIESRQKKYLKNVK